MYPEYIKKSKQFHDYHVTLYGIPIDRIFTHYNCKDNYYAFLGEVFLQDKMYPKDVEFEEITYLTLEEVMR